MTENSFDDRAATWDDEDKVARAQSVAATLERVLEPSGSERLLECGAGTGLVSQFLAGSVGPITLADPSAGMRTVAQQKIDAGALPGRTRIWDWDLETPPPSGELFDIVLVVLALHHVPDVAAALAGMASLLDAGGRLCLVDLAEEDGSFHAGHDDGGDDADGDDGGDDNGDHGDHGDGAHEHVHAGFAAPALRSMLADAGLQATIHDGIYDLVKNDRPYPLFLAVASRS